MWKGMCGNMAENEKLSREEIIALYQDDAMKLLQYYSWVKKVSGQKLSEIYKGENIEKTSMAVPVYDATLLQFIKTAKTTKFMNRNYVYTYSRNFIKTAEDEIRLIENSTLQDIRALGDILSSYCYKGDVRGAVWTDGIRQGVYLVWLDKINELLSVKEPRA